MRGAGAQPWPLGHRVALNLSWGPGCEPPSLVPREDGARKLTGLFGTEAGPDGDTTADKIFCYIPGTVSWWVGVSQLK